MRYSDDPLADFNAYDRDRQQKQRNLPQCDYCNETLDDVYYDIYGECVCEDCIRKYFRKECDAFTGEH